MWEQLSRPPRPPTEEPVDEARLRAVVQAGRLLDLVDVPLDEPAGPVEVEVGEAGGEDLVLVGQVVSHLDPDLSTGRRPRRRPGHAKRLDDEDGAGKEGLHRPGDHLGDCQVRRLAVNLWHGECRRQDL